MLKKFTRTLAIALLLLLACQYTVLAAVLEVDTASPDFKSDTWQNNDPTEVYPIELAFSTTHTRGDGDGNPVERFCACLQADTANIEGALTFINGTAVNNAVFPFKETVKIDSMTCKFNNGGRQFFFTFYTSMDNANWTEVTITGNASKVTVENSWDEFGATDGPAVECWASVPAGIADNEDVNPITFTFAQTVEAKYFKIVMYGNDGESGDLAISHAWFSFNSLKFEGEVVQLSAPVEAAAQVDVPEAAPAAQPAVVAAPATVTSAPQTGDADIIIFSLLGFASLAAYAVVMKRKAVR